MGNTQILIDLAWVLQRTSTLEKIYMLKYGRVIVECSGGMEHLGHLADGIG